MRKFLLHLVVFLLFPAFCTFFLYWLPVDRYYAYTFLDKGGCPGRSTWLYQQLFEDTTPIDIAFMGTSHTMNAVNDSLIATKLRENAGLSYRCLNLAYCDFGRNMDFVLVKDLLAHHKPKILFLEIRENEAQVGHKQFAWLAKGQDVLSAPIYFNRSFFPDLYKALMMRLQYLREQFTHEDEARENNKLVAEFGYNPSKGLANEQDLKNESQKAAGKSPQPTDDNPLNYAPMEYVAKIAAMCKDQNVTLVLHYLPQYGYSNGSLWLGNNYSSYSSEIFKMKQEFYELPANWYDAGHLNHEGATQFSNELAVYIASRERKL
ncbi:MAG: hypothetical protein IPH78_03030 [Bacteroidetes bacterium]|nr:hypothetical protein [Bacteroidota bacterium]